MKKMYIKPITETEGLEIKGQALCTSPAPGTLNNNGSGTGSVDTGGGDLIGN